VLKLVNRKAVNLLGQLLQHRLDGRGHSGLAFGDFAANDHPIGGAALIHSGEGHFALLNLPRSRTKSQEGHQTTFVILRAALWGTFYFFGKSGLAFTSAI
jgi:hypothetical protein